MLERRPNKWLSLFAWLLPDSRFKQWALRRLGNTIGEKVRISPTLVIGCGPFSLGDGTIIAGLNVFRNLSSVTLGRRCYIGNLNQFTAAVDYQRFSPLVGRLVMRDRAAMTNRHYFDCSGLILMEAYSGVGGIRSILQSHEIDLQTDETAPGRIVLGENAMTGTGCTLLKDSYLPDHSVLAARSLLVKAKDPGKMPAKTLYGGSPARPLKEIDNLAWWAREDYNTPPTPFDDTKFRLD